MLHLLHGFALSFVFCPNIFEKLTTNSYLFKVFFRYLYKLVNCIIKYGNFILFFRGFGVASAQEIILSFAIPIRDCFWLS